MRRPDAVWAEELSDSIWDRLVETDRGCWNWIGCRVSGGYGNVRLFGKGWLVHRLILLTRNGRLTTDY